MITYKSEIYVDGIRQEQQATIQELSDGLIKIKVSSEHFLPATVQIAWEDYDEKKQERLFMVQQRINTDKYKVPNYKYSFISQY